MISVELSNPITVGDEQIKVIDLREPTVQEVADNGYPFLIVEKNGKSGISIDVAVVLKYISVLSANPPSAFKSISLTDLSKLQNVVMSFFGEAESESKTS